MSNLAFEVCPDGHRCDNGSKCIEVPDDEGTFTCDCNAISKDEAFAGLKCEHKATQYCNDQNIISRSSFCTNGGQCTKLVSDSQAHFACDCTSDYVGDHCEFTKGVELPDHVKSKMSNTSSGGGGGGGLSGGGLAVILIVVIVAVLGVGLFLIRKKLRRWEADPTDARRDKDSARAAPELALEADGSVLTSAVASGAGVNSPAFKTSGTVDQHSASVYEIGDETDDDDEEKQDKKGAPATPSTASTMEIPSTPTSTSKTVDSGAAPVSTPTAAVENAAVPTPSPVSASSMENGTAAAPAPVTPSSPAPAVPASPAAATEEAMTSSDEEPTEPELV